MRRWGSLAMACAVSIACSPAHAGITISAVEVPNIHPTLREAGWTGFLLTLTADAESQKITTVEFSNNLLNLPGQIGIHGTLHQSWAQPAIGSATRIPTPSSTAHAPANDGTEVDSYFLSSGYYNISVPNPFTENNNQANDSSHPFTASPIPDDPPFKLGKNTVPGAAFGVGTSMTFTGSANVNTATSTLNLAFIIVPAGGALVPMSFVGGRVQVLGVALDPFNNAFPVGLSYVPEPARSVCWRGGA